MSLAKLNASYKARIFPKRTLVLLFVTSLLSSLVVACGNNPPDQLQPTNPATTAIIIATSTPNQPEPTITSNLDLPANPIATTENNSSPTPALAQTAPPDTTPTTPLARTQGCLAATTGTKAQACVSNSGPGPNSPVTVYGRLVVDGVAIPKITMSSNWSFRSGSVYCSGDSQANGVASCTRQTEKAGQAGGYYVYINVSFSYQGKTYTATTGFNSR